MKISDFTTNSNQLTESVKNFTDAGIPRAFAEKLLSQYRVKHDAELKPIEGKPRRADIDSGDMLINVLPSGEVLAVMIHFRRGQYSYLRVRYTEDGEIQERFTDSIGEATSGMTKRGPMFMLDHYGLSGNRHRGEKPTPDEIERRKTSGDTLAGSVADIFSYMNKTFLPRLKPQMEQMVDEIYSNLRKLPKDQDKYGSRLSSYSRDQRTEALAAAGAIEDIMEKGFTRDTLNDFLALEGVKIASRSYYGDTWKSLTDALTEFSKGDKLARAKWAKTFLAGAKHYWQMVMDMVDAPVMKALAGESIEETTSAGGIAGVAQPMGMMITRKPRSGKRKKAQEGNNKSPAGGPACWKGKKIHPTKPTKIKGGKRVNNCIDAGTNEEVELDEGSREWVLGALAAMGMIGSIASLDYTAKQALQNDQQLQTLISYYKDAKEAGDGDAMKQLEKRIANQKARIVGGQGPVRDASGTPIVPQRDRTTDARTSNLEEILHGDEFFETYGWIEWPNQITEAEHQGRKVKLNKPVRSTDGPKKFHVYVKDGDKVKKVNFGDPNMEIKRDNPERRKSFRARHKCDQKKDKTTAGYWSCKKW